jgi:prepilin-type N-terminal cleavage/methylation domain-containing protein
MKYKKAFTMVELIIVVIILAILITIGVVSYNGAQAGSRDTKRKSDVNTFVTAMTMYKVDNKTFSLPSADVGNSAGEGFVSTDYDVAGTKKSIVQYLTDRGYLDGKMEDPKHDADTCTPTNSLAECQDYVYYNFGSGLGTIYAKLEKPKYGGDNDRTAAGNALSSCTGCADFTTVMADYQFAKIIK